MKLEIDDKFYNLIIEKKRTTKNTYIRVKDDLTIYITTNSFTSNKYILNLLNENIDSIRKMLNKKAKKEEKKDLFFYLGKQYDIIYLNNKNIILGTDKVFINKDIDLDKWYKKQAEIIFKEEFDKMYHTFLYKIPYPSLTIRKMKTRWGVCNTKDIRITLNLELIKKDIKYLDYVIIHELSHLLYPNHSKDFWHCVGENMPNYKEIRKELKDE